VLNREFAIALRSRLTWLQAGLSALLVGHGFVLAIDLYSAGSRSVHASALMAREFDPLLGIVRPTLGGLYLSLSLLGPLVAARVLSAEKERRTLHALLLQTASPARVLAAKFAAASAGIALQLTAPIGLLLLWRLCGGRLAWPETAVPLVGYGLYALLIAAVSLMAAAWTATLAQAATLALMIVVTSWAIDASEGFAALAWLGRALDWSVTTHLAPFEHATFAVGACAWMFALTGSALLAAWVGLHRDRPPLHLALMLGGTLVVTASSCMLAQGIRRAFDLTEDARASLPPAVIRELRALREQLVLDVWLDRDDARRQQLESDALAKLRLARPDLVVRTPTDERSAPVEGERDPSYGRIVVHVGRRSRETYSTSRRELVTLMFEAAGRPTPDFTQTEYPGYPLSIEGGRRSFIAVCAYFGFPLALLMVGWLCTRSKRRN
jgi:hypothetical protein